MNTVAKRALERAGDFLARADAAGDEPSIDKWGRVVVRLQGEVARR